MSWEVPRYRIKAYIRGLRRLESHAKKYKKAPFRLRRTLAELKIIEGSAFPPDIMHARVVLNDISPWGLMLFTSTPLREGQVIAITIQEPYLFYAQGKVMSCHPASLSARILTENPHPYRVQIKFEFHSLFERNAVRMYCQEVLKKYLFGTA